MRAVVFRQYRRDRSLAGSDRAVCAFARHRRQTRLPAEAAAGFTAAAARTAAASRRKQRLFVRLTPRKRPAAREKADHSLSKHFLLSSKKLPLMQFPGFLHQGEFLCALRPRVQTPCSGPAEPRATGSSAARFSSGQAAVFPALQTAGKTISPRRFRAPSLSSEQKNPPCRRPPIPAA